MGTVYLADDPKMDRQVAIKVLHEHLTSPDARTRFLSEVKLLIRLEHAQIVPVYEYGEENNQPYLVMRYMSSGSLKDRLRIGPLPFHEVRAILEPIADALDFMHQQGYIHRDLKPGNILFDARGKAYLSDFGIARPTEQTSTFSATAIGTFAYMAPEQWQLRPLSPATDVYQLGVLTYELLTGHKPFFHPPDKDNLYGRYMESHLYQPVPSLRQYAPALPTYLDKVIQRALAKKPEERFPTAEAFVQALNKASHTSPNIPTSIRGTALWLGMGVLALCLLLLTGARLIRSGGTNTTDDNNQSSNSTEGSSTSDKTQMIPPEMLAEATPGTTWLRPIDGMTLVFVPGGMTTIGSTDEEISQAVQLCEAVRGVGQCDRTLFSHEQPAHDVSLAAFWLDQTEVSQAQYAQCVVAGVCAPISSSATLAGDGNDPVVNITWDQAQLYCDWVGGSLPTEAQWEYAARGPERHLYPWGEGLTGREANSCDGSCSFGFREASFNDGFAQVAPVNQYADGASWVGALNLAGNVWEWVADWYAPYPATPQDNPTGPTEGVERVIRGGSWGSNSWLLRGATRASALPATANDNRGFRCVLPVIE